MDYPDIVCINCGRLTHTKSKKRIRCDDCKKKVDHADWSAKMAVKRASRPPKTVRCQRCGTDVLCIKNGVPKYCQSCRLDARREQCRTNDAKRRPALIVGSDRICADCGATFAFRGGNRCDVQNVSRRITPSEESNGRETTQVLA